MKKRVMIRKHYELFLLGIIFSSVLIGLIIAEGAANTHKITVASDGTTSLIIKEDQPFVFNLTINNSFSDNVTWVNVTIHSTFAFTSGSNGSNTINIGGTDFANFTNTTTLLSWQAATSLVLPNTNSSFWFTATASTPGSYALIVNTANSSGSFVNTTNITITVMEIHNVMSTAGIRDFVIDEDITSLFNITLNSTVAVASGNITNITVTFESGLAFTLGSNNTWLYAGVGTTFTNTSTSITWVGNSTYTGGILSNARNGSVWFNLSAANPGTYKFNVTTVNSQDNGTHIQNFIVTVRDITKYLTTKATSGNAYLIVKEDQPFTFNITVNSSLNGNVSQFNITIPSSFAFELHSNGTSATNNIGGEGYFSNTTTMLGWANTTYLGSLVQLNTNTTFWFNATPSTPGNYSLFFAAANRLGNAISINESNITVMVMEIHNVMVGAGNDGIGTYNFSTINEDTQAIFNISLNSTVPVALGNITNITVTFPSTFNFTVNSNNTWLYAGVGTTFTNTSTSITWVGNSTYTGGILSNARNGSVWFNLSAQEPGNYILTLTTKNSQDNETHIQNFTVSVRDITDPVPAYTCSKTSVNKGENIGCSCTAADNYDSSPTVVYTSTLTTTDAGTYNIYCTATDDSGNVGSASVTYTVHESVGSFASGSGGTTYTQTFVEDTKEFSVIKEISKQLNAKSRIRIMINSIKHEIGVKELTSSGATIEVSSTPQTATLKIGDTRKFDLTNDDYYDISVTLNKIVSGKADLTLKLIYEKIITAPAVQKQEEQAVAEEQASQSQEEEEMPEVKGNTITLVIVIIIIILILVGIGYWIKKRR